jgi:hypothetical protein
MRLHDQFWEGFFQINRLDHPGYKPNMIRSQFINMNENYRGRLQADSLVVEPSPDAVGVRQVRDSLPKDENSHFTLPNSA